MEGLGYYNGEIGDLDQITCSIMDRAVYFGDGCYDMATVRNGIIFALKDHIDRFYNSCRWLYIVCPYSKHELEDILYSIVNRFNCKEECALYWQISRGTVSRFHSFPDDNETTPNIMAYITKRSISPKDKTFNVISIEDKRYKLCHIKTLNQLPNVLATQQAKEAGCKEAIFCRDGMVTEMAHSNISFLKNGKLYYHPFDWKILPGISVKHLIAKANSLGIPVIEKELSIVEAMNADELILTSTGAICHRIVKCDNVSVGGNDEETYKKLREAVFDEYINDTSLRS